MGVGRIDPAATKLIEVTERSLDAAIAELRDGQRLGDVGHAVQAVVEAAGYAVVEDYTGHAIGRALHEDPQVPNLGRRGKGTRVRTGNVFAVEPMVNVGTPDTVLLEDGWTVVTADGSLSAHVEHTIAVTDDGPEILTAAG
jgi:methionyl aminopeptidase